MAWLLLLSNAGAIANCIFYKVLYNMTTETNSGLSIVTVSFLVSLSIFVEDFGFSLGQWIFSFQYYNIAKQV